MEAMNRQSPYNRYRRAHVSNLQHDRWFGTTSKPYSVRDLRSWETTSAGMTLAFNNLVEILDTPEPASRFRGVGSGDPQQRHLTR